jgi:4-hydroxy-2-oxoheptanedioate aldolase
MPAPHNAFKQALGQQSKLIGCWLGFADSYAAEMMGTAGFDWLVIDGEHGPNDIRSIRDQLIALESSASHPVVRLPMDEVWMIKQALDIGAQTLLIPMVETAEQAAQIVAAMRYAPEGIRGMGGALARATKYSQIKDYVTTASDQLALIVQVETAKGIENLAEIAAIDGVDGVFIGPADLSADMGFPGNAKAPEVVEAIAHAAEVINASGKSAGILAIEDATAQRYMDMGYTFVAVGIDLVMLMNAARAKAQQWKDG